MKELIEYYRLAENDTVFAYDLAWEPSHGSYEQQQRAYAKSWNDWVLQRYGSVAAAEKTWGISAPRRAQTLRTLDVPPMAQLTAEAHGASWWRITGLFLDDQLREQYGAARKLVKSIDPHHAVSFRMSCAGDPSTTGTPPCPTTFTAWPTPWISGSPKPMAASAIGTASDRANSPPPMRACATPASR